MEFIHDALTSKIIECFYLVYNQLGYGFLEKVYERALWLELNACGLVTQAQYRIKVHYKGQVVGDYFADLWVEGNVLIEIKTAEAIAPEHHKQLQNYLKATAVEVGLLLNFGPKPQVVRKIFTNDRKGGG